MVKMSLPKRSAPYWSKPPVFIFWHLRTLALRVPECQKGWVRPVWSCTLWSVTIWHHWAWKG